MSDLVHDTMPFCAELDIMHGGAIMSLADSAGAICVSEVRNDGRLVAVATQTQTVLSAKT